jgi:hypothetical protein
MSYEIRSEMKEHEEEEEAGGVECLALNGSCRRLEVHFRASDDQMRSRFR